MVIQLALSTVIDIFLSFRNSYACKFNLGEFNLGNFKLNFA